MKHVKQFVSVTAAKKCNKIKHLGDTAEKQKQSCFTRGNQKEKRDGYQEERGTEEGMDAQTGVEAKSQ